MEISVANYNRHEPKIELKPKNLIGTYNDSRRSSKVIFLYNFEYLYIVFCEYIKKRQVASF